MVLRRRDHPCALLGPLATLGRAPEAELVLQSARASARHAEVRFRGSHWEIRDLASRNGTFLGGRPLSPTSPEPLEPGDVLRFGDPEEEWHVIATPAPWPCLFDPRTGGRVEADGGAIDGLLAYDLEASTWRDAAGREVSHGELVGDRILHLPSPRAVATTLHNPVHLDGCTLTLRISADASRVDLHLQAAGWSTELVGRAWAGAIFALARARTASDDGWLAPERLARRTQLDRKVLDVYLSRAREALVRAGVVDGARLVEVRPGGRRLGLGPSRLRFETT